MLPGWSVANSLIDGEAAVAIVSAELATSIARFCWRVIDDSSRDSASAYGYAGPVWQLDFTEDLRAKLLHSATYSLAKASAISGFVRFHLMLAGGQSVPDGVVVDHSPTVTIDEGLDAIAEFADLYRKTISRIGSSSRHLFSDKYFKELKRSLSCNLMLASVRVDGLLTEESSFTVSSPSGFVAYHLSGSFPFSRDL